MFLTQQLVPRWTKEWLPLATQQLRLRNLIKILVFGIKNDKNDFVESNTKNSSNAKDESYYFTLHSTTMSAPFYTSEKLSSDNPKWKELEMSSWEGSVCKSVDAVVIRLWFSSPEETEDKVLAVWGIYLSGLMYLGPKLKKDMPLKPNSIVFLMPGGYFTDPKCIETNLRLRHISVIVKACDVRSSYSVGSLKRLQTLQLVIKKELAEAEILKKKISMGDFFRNESRGRTTLRKLLNKHKPKTNQVDLMRVKENIEITKYRVDILREEKETLLQRIKNLNSHIKLMSDSNKLLESKILENIRLLRIEMENHREWRRSYIDKREKFLHSKALLNFRKKQLISELNLIYPIVEVSPDKFTICGVHLPNSEDFAGHDELQISVALGFVTHIVQMISVFLQTPLRYPVIHYGSRSRIIDHITDKISDSEREFCLFAKGKEKLQFHYAVYLLNKNIAQMRWLCGLPTSDLRNTLENLSTLVKLKVGNTTLDQCSRSLSSSTADICSSNLSISSPLGSIVSFQFKKFHRTALNVKEDTRGGVLKTVGDALFIKAQAHRSSRSMGSAKDFASSKIKRNSLNDVNVNTLSCSLDEGLNEFGETRKKDLDQFGSEPTLNTSSCNLPKINNSDVSQVWETGSSKNFHSGDEFEEKVMGANAKTLQNFSDTVSKMESNERYPSDVDAAVEALVSDYEKAETADYAEVESTKVKQSFTLSNEKLCDVQNVAGNESSVDNDVGKCDLSKTILMGDSLLENVANRTEALVHQTTSFNRFRSRLKSTLESSN